MKLCRDAQVPEVRPRGVELHVSLLPLRRDPAADEAAGPCGDIDWP